MAESDGQSVECYRLGERILFNLRRRDEFLEGSDMQRFVAFSTRKSEQAFVKHVRKESETEPLTFLDGGVSCHVGVGIVPEIPLDVYQSPKECDCEAA